jgi:ketosteroid isomerase-like protein
MFADVLAANQRFYDAHEERDIEAMSNVWDHGDDAVCVHPGWPILRAWPPIEDSWRRIFAGPGRNQFILTNVSATGAGDVVWVTLDENLMQNGATGTVAATNAFAFRDGQWRLVLHHASPIS